MLQTNHPVRTSVLGIVAMFNVVLFAPVDVRAQEETLAAAPSIDASWDETSGYGAVEAVRAAIGDLSWDDARDYGSVDASRVIAARQALLTGDLGSMQEEALLAVVDAGAPQDEISGYGSVEAPSAVVCEESAFRLCRK
ncbi:MAG: hypothetical protein ACRDJC_12740 [Thermomicrobiales bacterium]